jgi:UDP-2-acetamido-2,6-beta-L-arabino-hexul-4-ose reductase
MIVGNGLLANGFIEESFDHKKFIVFVSGVSNSKKTNEEDFNREKTLLLKTILENKLLKLLYFSSILTGVQDNRYYQHKLEVEDIVKKNSKDYIIFRVPQIIGKGGNKNNLVNYLKQSLISGEEMIIFKNTYRSLIDVIDLVRIVNYCKDIVSCDTIYISDIEKIMVLDLLKNMSIFLGVNPKYKLIEGSNNNWSIKNSGVVNEAILKLKITTSGYTNKIIKKYIN